MSDLKSVSKSRPCPVCGGDHKCSVTTDGLILCGRESGPQPGFVHLGPCKDPTWHMYRPGDLFTGGDSPGSRLALARAMPAAARVTREVSLGSRPGLARTGTVTPSMTALAETLAANLLPLRAADLAHRLGLPVDTLGLLPLLGYDPAENCWTFPEVDPAGPVVGILRRFPDGSKKAVAGSRRGLTLAGGWADTTGPVFLVEGPTDTLALAACRLSAVGRPSNQGGTDLLVTLLAPLDPARQVVVVGENDARPDGRWPGKDGAKALAADLATRLGRPVLCSLPPAAYKDVREWVVDRYQGAADGFDWAALGAEIARDLVAHAVTFQASPEGKPGEAAATLNGLVLSPKKFPVPTPVSALGMPGAGGVAWVWDGFLARDAVTLLSALPKCGKTTLLAHLLAALPRGGEFCGRPLAPGRAVVVSEEPPGVWAARREEVGLTDAVRVIPRGQMVKCGGADEWAGFVEHLAGVLDADPADLVVFDTLANLWPVKDENSAAEVGAALAPLHRLTPGRAVLLIHHLRKSDGAEGTGSRGSGALAGFVDVIAELRRMKPSSDPGQRKRVLSGYGRYDAIPAEWVVELVEASPGLTPGEARPRFEHRDGGKTNRPDRDGPLRVAILNLLGDAMKEGLGLTRKEIWESLPDAVRKNESRFKEQIEAGVGVLWRKEERLNRDGGPVYRYGLSGDGEGDEG